MSTEYSTSTLDLNHPRSIWTNVIQLFYTLLAMIPIFYYMREVVQLGNDGLYILLFAPISIGLLLYILQILMNEYYWIQEKVHKKRDIFLIAVRSSSFVLFNFYFIYLLIFGYWFSSSDVYLDTVNLTNPIGKVITEAGISVALILFIVLLRRGIQKQK